MTSMLNRLGKRLRSFGVREKLVLTLLTALLVTLVTNAWLSYHSQADELLAEAGRRGQQTSKLMSRYLAYSVISHDYHAIELHLKELVGEQDITYMRVRNARGNTMAEAGSLSNDSDEQLMLKEDIRLDEQVVGTLEIVMTPTRLLTELRAEHKASLVRQGLAIVVITLIQMLALTYFILRPLNRISEGIHRNLDEGTAQNIDTGSSDEFGAMARELNLLRERLEESNRRLSERAAATDNELEQANQRLIEQADELRRKNDELEQLSITDPLTGFYNRRYFEELMDSEVQSAIRNDDTCSILLLDIDNFKKLNDQYGHNTGDQILRDVAAIIGSRVRRSDVACRFGGDEFFVLCRRATIANAMNIAYTLHEAVTARPLLIDRAEISISLSIGVATIPSKDNVTTADEFFNCADMALYHSKQAGRNVISHYSMVDKKKFMHG